MKLSAYHKALGDQVEMLNRLCHYDLVYASKTFSFTPDVEDGTMVFADEIRRGGTGYCISLVDGREVFDGTKDAPLPKEIEHAYPDYELYPQYKYAVGFLTRGCPRGCGFCVVSKKEGKCSVQVADLNEFWRGQKELKLMDPNILACKDHEELLWQLAYKGPLVDFTQGIDVRLLTETNVDLLNRIRTKMIHFAWDDPKQDLTRYFNFYDRFGKIKDHRKRCVYVLTNYNSTIDEDLWRIYTLRGWFDPYVMIYDKENAPRITRLLQRWCNNKIIFNSEPDFAKYDEKKG